MANTAVLTSSVERRVQEPDAKPVWERKITFTIEASGGHDELTHTVIVNGILQEAVIEVGTTTQGSETVEVDFDDNNDVEFSANTALAENTDTFLSFYKPVNNFKIRVDPLDDPDSGADWVIVVTCRGI